MEAILILLFQEECLLCMRLRSWTYPQCAYRLRQIRRGRPCRRRWWRGSVCWDRDRRI